MGSHYFLNIAGGIFPFGFDVLPCWHEAVSFASQISPLLSHRSSNACWREGGHQPLLFLQIMWNIHMFSLVIAGGNKQVPYVDPEHVFFFPIDHCTKVGVVGRMRILLADALD